MQTPINIHAERNRKISQTMREKRARGEVAGRLPLGYKVISDDRGNSYVADDSEIQRLIQLARELQKQGVSIRKTSAILFSLGLQSTSGRPLSPASLWRAMGKRIAD